ncbi:hypothetical protein CTZ24_04345 [Pantoea phytobeneficialis]|uniref:Uncharacterized protein n=1 Tax=Pantoea phytobeneficialis TaxID=2052056 RepID=A0AAP9H350_9GAMM|nr:hypothetical protein CTZ24_04345 [Pantoea phytobeneficialis]
MTLTKKTKFILRWGGIMILSISYFLSLIIASISYSDIYENLTLQQSDFVPLTEYWATIEYMIEYINLILDIAFLGFIICVPLILIIFKKVR